MERRAWTELSAGVRGQEQGAAGACHGPRMTMRSLGSRLPGRLLQQLLLLLVVARHRPLLRTGAGAAVAAEAKFGEWRVPAAAGG